MPTLHLPTAQQRFLAYRTQLFTSRPTSRQIHLNPPPQLLPPIILHDALAEDPRPPIKLIQDGEDPWWDEQLEDVCGGTVEGSHEGGEMPDF